MTSSKETREETEETREFFKLHKDIAKRKDLTLAAKVVYSIILNHIGRNEDGYPGVRKIGKESALARATITKSIKQLEKAGLLLVRRKNRCVNRYTDLAETVLESRTDNRTDKKQTVLKSRTDNGIQSRTKLSQKVDSSSIQSRTDLSQKVVTNRIDSIEKIAVAPAIKVQAETTTPTPPPKTAAADSVFSYLKSLGVGEPMLSRLSQREGMSPTRIKRCWNKSKSKEYPVGYLVKMLDSHGEGYSGPLEAQQAAQMIRDGSLTEICGWPLPPGCAPGYNEHGLTIFTDETKKVKLRRFTPEQLRRNSPAAAADGKPDSALVPNLKAV